MNDLTIIVPAYNEETALALFLPELMLFCETNGCRLIIVNDGSSDKTSDLLERHRQVDFFTPLNHKVNRGYGGAIKTGICAAQTPYIITIDADGQHRPEDIVSLYQFMQERDADMVVGRRKKHKESTYRKIGKMLIHRIATLLMPIHIQDLNSGMKLYRTELAKNYIQLYPDTMAFSDIVTLVFINQRHLVVEQPITVTPRIAGQSTISTKTAIDTVMEILHIVTLFNPMRIFLPPAIFFLIFSAVWGLPILFRGEGISVGTLFLFVTGLIFFFLGLIAEQLALIRKNQALSLRTEPPADG